MRRYYSLRPSHLPKIRVCINDLAVFRTYAAFLVYGNLITNRPSIGSKTHFTGPDPPSPTIVRGLDTHADFKGMSRLSSVLIFTTQ